MKCEDVIEDLRTGTVPLGAALRASCRVRACARRRRQALVALELERAQPVPRLAEGAFERALLRAVQPLPPMLSAGAVSGSATVVGGALAASVAMVVTAWWLQPQSAHVEPRRIRRCGLLLHEVRAVNVALDSPVELMGAEIHVVLTGAVGLQGFAEQRSCAGRRISTAA